VACASPGFFSSSRAIGSPVEEDDDVGPAVLAGLDDGELVHDQPVVDRRLLPVDEPDQCCTHLAGCGAVLDRHPAGEQLVDALVLREGVLRLRAQQPGDRLLDDVRRQVGVDAQCRLAQASGENHLVVRRALRHCAAGRQDGSGESGGTSRAPPARRCPR